MEPAEGLGGICPGPPRGQGCGHIDIDVDLGLIDIGPIDIDIPPQRPPPPVTVPDGTTWQGGLVGLSVLANGDLSDPAGKNSVSGLARQLWQGVVDAFAQAGLNQPTPDGWPIYTLIGLPELAPSGPEPQTNEEQLSRDLGPAALFLGTLAVGKLSGTVFKAPAVPTGTKVYRVYGGGSKASGASWTTVDPRTIPNYRNVAGLPNKNTGRFLIEGTVSDGRGMRLKTADALDGNTGGLPEVIIQHSALDLLLDQSSLLTPGL